LFEKKIMWGLFENSAVGIEKRVLLGLFDNRVLWGLFDNRVMWDYLTTECCGGCLITG